jgi:hypothetical protein
LFFSNRNFRSFALAFLVDLIFFPDFTVDGGTQHVRRVGNETAEAAFSVTFKKIN